MARERRAPAVLLILTILGASLAVAWIYTHRASVRAQVAPELSCDVTYKPGPPKGDVLAVTATAPAGWMNLSTQRLNGALLWNTTIPDAATAEWDFNATRGLVRVLCVQPGSAPVASYAWIGNGTVFVGDSIQDLLSQAGVERAS